MIKKSILVFALCIESIFCFAQPEHHVSLGISLFGYEYIQECLRELEYEEYHYPNPYDHGTFEYTDEFLKHFPFSLNAHYEYKMSKHFGVGLCLGYDHLKMEQETEIITSVGDEMSPHGITYTLWDSSHKFGTLHRHVLHVMPEVSVYWFKKKYFAMYSKVAAGVRFNVEKRKFETYSNDAELKDFHFYCHVAPVCFETGGENWLFFGEFGYGAQGILHYGVRRIIKEKFDKLNE